MLGKPSGGSRTVAKTPMWWRTMCKLDTYVENWDNEHIQSYDTAGKGKSVLVAAALRNVFAEVSVILGFQVGMVLNDIEKFFDIVDLNRLTEQAVLQGFPH